MARVFRCPSARVSRSLVGADGAYLPRSPVPAGCHAEGWCAIVESSMDCHSQAFPPPYLAAGQITQADFLTSYGSWFAKLRNLAALCGGVCPHRRTGLVRRMRFVKRGSRSKNRVTEPGRSDDARSVPCATPRASTIPTHVIREIHRAPLASGQALDR